jgi:hypothetical protein
MNMQDFIDILDMVERRQVEASFFILHLVAELSHMAERKQVEASLFILKSTFPGLPEKVLTLRILNQLFLRYFNTLNLYP